MRSWQWGTHNESLTRSIRFSAMQTKIGDDGCKDIRVQLYLEKTPSNWALWWMVLLSHATFMSAVAQLRQWSKGASAACYYQFSLFAACIVKSSCPRNQLYTFSKRTRASMDYVWGLCFWNRHTGLSQWCFTWWLKIIVGISACINSDVNLVKRPSTDGLKPHCWGWMHASSANLHSLAGTKHTALTFFANTHFGKQTTETQWNGIDWQLERNINERKVDQRKVCKIFICWSRLEM